LSSLTLCRSTTGFHRAAWQSFRVMLLGEAILSASPRLLLLARIPYIKPHCNCYHIGGAEPRSGSTRNPSIASWASKTGHPLLLFGRRASGPCRLDYLTYVNGRLSRSPQQSSQHPRPTHQPKVTEAVEGAPARCCEKWQVKNDMSTANPTRSANIDQTFRSRPT